MFRDRTGTALKDLLESKKTDGAVRVISEAFKSKKLQPEDFSLREIWEACEPGHSVSEAVTSDAFPKITGELINAKIINAYDSVEKIGDDLCVTIPSKLKIDTIAGFTEVEAPREVPEGHEYDDSTMTEKYVTIHNKKFGRILSVTEEMVYFDQTGQVLARAARIGAKAAQYRERIILRGVQDVDGNVYRPSGVATALYSSDNANLQTSNPLSEAGLETVYSALINTKDDSEDEDFILINRDNVICLVPSTLEVEAWQLANSTLTPESAENAANFFKGRFKIASSPYVDVQSTTTWYFGDFKQQFIWEEVWPLSVITAPVNHYDSFKKDIKSLHKCRFYGGFGAVDHRFVQKSTA